MRIGGPRSPNAVCHIVVTIKRLHNETDALQVNSLTANVDANSSHDLAQVPIALCRYLRRSGIA